jgi:hypothetical protein
MIMKKAAGEKRTKSLFVKSFMIWEKTKTTTRKENG